jgi:hypothetical protein
MDMENLEVGLDFPSPLIFREEEIPLGDRFREVYTFAQLTRDLANAG